ncbi:hypothetical protein B566_EDAN016132 [Ephemera danica]|nr:hypothetical protein B566_EDAN016132 [Ephemera danica]
MSEEPMQDEVLSVDMEERRHFLRIVNAFKQYRTCSLIKIARTEKYLTELPPHHQKLLDGYKNQLRRVADCVAHNDTVIQEIIKHAGSIFEADHPAPDIDEMVTGPPTVAELDKVLATIKQFMRDWSVEGQAERVACYGPIISAIQTEFSKAPKSNEVTVLVPGAGLGRLVFEIAQQGFSCQGNEFSLFMLLASNFVLNKCLGTNVYSIFPWAAQTINVLRAEDQVKEVWFPDINPAEKPLKAEISMAAGDFLEIYTEPDNWDCVATCFFIDCAHNIVDFVETIYKILKPVVLKKVMIDRYKVQ